MIVQQKTFKSYDKLEQYFINESEVSKRLGLKLVVDIAEKIIIERDLS